MYCDEDVECICMECVASGAAAEKFDGYDDAREFLTKDGSLCGYLFRCLHCGKYKMYIDAD